ncbi:RNA polymerase sigma-54 factor [Alloalcanivorax dieselolei B5]|uniref:RNA polymerase sigma-54 factor n=1 Tax=Alcanivorax dieselolei (strain DSM 16502 / CGMCC 1.3690 / MCCC 1A00001 / B-5) TaxID=930169 RepID=K0CGY9_ALCDB|nr:RNA polymerase factor sigma-54 [Alloalcanivorax dieselolei]AFT71843.1 RNA polymerase sigma-54 factor [Alloalcanivorax dieselolei B5]
MKPSLQLQIGQQLTMTPQLQQAIRLLQLSTLDLRQEIQQAVETNPLLELEEGVEAYTEDDTPADDDWEAEEMDLERDEALDDLVDGPVESDSEWDDLYVGQSGSGSGGGEDDDADAWQQRHVAPVTLQDHLLWQLNLSPMSDRDRVIAGILIDALDHRGYLSLPLDDLLDTAERQIADADDPVEEDEVVAVLHRLQQFDPIGVASRDLAECLGVQLRQQPADTPHLDTATALLGHLALLEKHDYAGLRRTMGVTESDLLDALALLRTLDPAPGEQIGGEVAEYAVPDVVVRPFRGGWRVELNEEVLPKVNLNAQYARLARRTEGEDGQYLRNCMQEARWFLKSLQSRNDTLLKVARRIVEVQQDFFHYGEEAMKPLVLADIAEAVEMHESTISRVTNQKFMLTPRGVFELKYFFSSHVDTEGGGECSSTAIRAIIKKLVAAENPRKPLSDNKLASLLNEQGIKVARRTVAKYREAMRIPSSSARKRLV